MFDSIDIGTEPTNCLKLSTGCAIIKGFNRTNRINHLQITKQPANFCCLLKTAHHDKICHTVEKTKSFPNRAFDLLLKKNQYTALSVDFFSFNQF
ncbi:MAG: hypothetical protein D6160_15115 [Ketobacter sp.]|nr:MAG: hypothetical protein D6160_15115 [Ketobacter sp.]